MPLADHLRELRNRLAKRMLAIIVITIVAAMFYKDIIHFFTEPILGSWDVTEFRGAGKKPVPAPAHVSCRTVC